ncbi:tyrosine-protein kinase [Ravibacter arvi]|uniref:non-specific protein-tyrosine kinase n=1 Tax=Ravibacter arvi TaxID=2051041 RepID=A0ABP8M7K5_9BACT
MNTTELNGFEERNSTEEEFNLGEYVQRYLRYWYLFPFFIGLAAAAAWYYFQVTQPVYKSTASLLIKDEKKGVRAGADDILSELSSFSGNKLVENEIEILRSRNLMEQVIKDLKLEVSYSISSGLKTIDIYKKSPFRVVTEVVSEKAYEDPMEIELVDKDFYNIPQDDELREFGKLYYTDWGTLRVFRDSTGDAKIDEVTVHFRKPERLVENMLKNLSVAQSNKNSTVLELDFEDTSPQRGIDVLNKLLDVYVGSSITDKNTEASNTLAFIEERLGLITSELGDVEKDVEVYKSQKGLTDVSAESQLFLENMKENDSKLNEVNTQIRVLEGVESYISRSGDGAVAPATYLINDPMLVSLLNRYSELNLQKEKYARTLQPDNPIMETVNTQVAQTRQSIRENLQNMRRGLDMTRQNLEGINTRFSAGLRSLPQKEREYVGIKRQQTIKENLYLYLLQKREETALAFASTVTDSRLVDAPRGSNIPVKPKKSLIGLGALLAGMAIPILLINLLMMLNNTVQSREEVERLSGAPVVGEIGRMKQSGQPGLGDVVIKTTSRSAVAEQFRALRTNLQYLGDGSGRVLMLTSSIGGEGKSFVSINLAASLAYSDKRVLLVGADLRKPTVHTNLKMINDKGLTNYLITKGDAAGLIKPSGVHELFEVMLSGPIPPNPSELLNNGRLPVLIEELKERYDYILIDSPPYGLVTDASLISEYVDATLYLVRHNYTLRDHMKNIRLLIRQKRFKNLSVVFNAVNYGAGYGYGYGYGGYGYGYYSEDKESKPRSVIDQLARKGKELKAKVRQS